MFGSLGVPELIFIFALALLIFGPRKLPEIGRTIGRGLSEFRKASTDLKRSINAEMIEEEMRQSDPRNILSEPPSGGTREPTSGGTSRELPSGGTKGDDPPASSPETRGDDAAGNAGSPGAGEPRDNAPPKGSVARSASSEAAADSEAS